MRISQQREPDAVFNVTAREREIERLREFLTNWDTWVRVTQVPANVAEDVKELLTGMTTEPTPPSAMRASMRAHPSGIGFE